MSVYTEKSGRVARLIMDRPPLNILDRKLAHGLLQSLSDLREDPDIHALVITSAHAHFSAGADIKELGNSSPAEMHEFAECAQELMDAVEHFPAPVIAAIPGNALGGGTELALAADVRICTDSARFALPEVLLGLIPAGGGTQRLPRLVGLAHARDMLLTGRTLDAGEARRIGLVDLVVPEEDLRAAAGTWAERYCSNPRRALAAVKKTISASTTPTGNRVEQAEFLKLLTTADRTEYFQRFWHGHDRSATARRQDAPLPLVSE